MSMVCATGVGYGDSMPGNANITIHIWMLLRQKVKKRQMIIRNEGKRVNALNEEPVDDLLLFLLWLFSTRASNG